MSNKKGIALLELCASLMVLVPIMLLAAEISQLTNEKERLETALNQEIRQLQKNIPAHLAAAGAAYTIEINKDDVKRLYHELTRNLNSYHPPLGSSINCQTLSYGRNDKIIFSESINESTRGKIKQLKHSEIHESNLRNAVEKFQAGSLIKNNNFHPLFCSLAVTRQVDTRIYTILSAFSGNLQIAVNSTFFLFGGI